MTAKLSPGMLRAAIVALAVTGLAACAVLRPPGYDDFKTAVSSGDALRIYDTLEALIAEDDDTRNDRKMAFAAVRNRNEDTAAFQFAWAAIAGKSSHNNSAAWYPATLRPKAGKPTTKRASTHSADTKTEVRSRMVWPG